MSVSTHVLDSVSGRPAVGIAVRLFAGADPVTAEPVAAGVTDADGRCRLVEGPTAAGTNGTLGSSCPISSAVGSFGASAAGWQAARASKAAAMAIRM